MTFKKPGMNKGQKKILIISPYFAPAWGFGGPPKINYGLAKHLSRKYHVEVWTTDAFKRKLRYPLAKQQLDRIKILRFKNFSNWLAWRHKIFLPLGFVQHLRQNIQKFDFVFLSDFRDWQNIFTYKFCLRHNISYGLAAYGQLPISQESWLKKNIKRLYDFLWGKEMIKQAVYLFGQTQHEIQEYLKLGGQKKQCQLLPLGIDVQELRSSLIKNNFRQDYIRYISRLRLNYKIEPREKIILFVGRINYLKGIDLLVKAMPMMLKKIPRLRLIIIGRDDGYQQQLQKLIRKLDLSEKIIILGPLYGKDNHPAYLSADVFAFTPRHFEETSLACLEALASGRPIVTTKQAPIPFLEKYRAGFEIPFSQKLLVEKLTTILKNPKLAKEMGKNGKRLVKEVFDLPKAGSLLESHINKAILNEKK
jgi:glycosyltransferase involved in cell wall biosynthesis